MEVESKAMPKKESNEKGSRIGDRSADLRSSVLSQMTLLVTRRNDATVPDPRPSVPAQMTLLVTCRDDPTFPPLGPYSHENTGRLSK